MQTMRLFAEEGNREVVCKKSNKKSETKKEATVAFQRKLKKIEEAEETPSKSSEDRNRMSNIRQTTSRNNARPQSARCLSRREFERKFRKRSKSSETFLDEDRKRESVPETKRRLKEMFGVRETSCRGKLRCKCATLFDLESRCSSFYACRTRSRSPCDCDTDWWTSYNHYKAGAQKRRCRSNSSFSKTIFERVKDIHKMERSLKLIGLELSDFGICSNGDVEITPRCKLKPRSSTLSTKVTGRSFSLDSLRHAIRRAWLDDCLDESHRRLLSQAAYEEWYFKKERELQEKLKEERQKRAVMKENIKKDFERKKAKAEEEYLKWMQRKRVKRRKNENLENGSEQRLGKTRKTKQDTETAFLKWKKEKDKELKQKKLQKQKEEAKKMESERRKNEKKIIAEKAFQQWKIKLEENEKLEGQRRMKLKRKQEELGEMRKQEEASQISFQLWKKAKDEEIQQRMKQIREISKLEREQRQARTEERMYEAEQAFEDWLEKIDLRKQKQFCDSFQKIPWIPA